MSWSHCGGVSHCRYHLNKAMIVINRHLEPKAILSGDPRNLALYFNPSFLIFPVPRNFKFLYRKMCNHSSGATELEKNIRAGRESDNGDPNSGTEVLLALHLLLNDSE
ncbi:uncharacterized protein LAJ45_05024 [Morchella importuna]|uniref:uncharacterized protein n=1 Tax=Morchella importuna TaxID=1174673 RepID=UPI001E8E2627|nr:uncharacterized protein LAJ45_05024 [Morchella importuna]KAH8150843.1 hypothetical protein LAJ45_05024 [Morchella importuna]